MKLPERPQQPEASAEVREWFRAKHGSRPSGGNWPIGWILQEDPPVAGDAPPAVLALVDAWTAWLAADEAWRQRAPIDVDPVGDRVRFFGGDWLPTRDLREVLCAEWGGEFHSAPFFDSIERAFDRMDEPEFRAFVAGVYEHIRVREAAHVALVRHLLAGGGS